MATSPHPSPTDRIREQALALGFDAVGFAPAALGPEAKARLLEFLEKGYHGDMGWMETRIDERTDPKTLWNEARTVISLGMSYAPPENPMVGLVKRDRAVISAYARGRDYHDVVKKKLKELARWIVASFDPCAVKVFVDTAPVMERPLAELAGLGWQGKNTMLVSRDHGCWLFLGEIYTTLDLAPDPAGEDHCGRCTRCLDICPTRAFVAPRVMDARRCVSYLTIEHKGHIPRDLRPMMGNRIYGCDDCLAVCPWNKFAAVSPHAAFHPREELIAPRLAELAALDDPAFRALFSGSPVKRTGRDRFVRNVLIAIGNSNDPTLAPTAQALLTDASPLVRAAAIWSLACLLPQDAFAALKAQHLPQESDAEVREEWEADTETGGL